MGRNEILKNSKLNIVTDASTITQYFPHTLVLHSVFIKNNRVVYIEGFETMYSAIMIVIREKAQAVQV